MERDRTRPLFVTTMQKKMTHKHTSTNTMFGLGSVTEMHADAAFSSGEVEENTSNIVAI